MTLSCDAVFGCVYKAVTNDDLLSLFTTSRKVDNGSQYLFGVFRLPMGTKGNQWQPTPKLFSFFCLPPFLAYFTVTYTHTYINERTR